MIIRTGLVFTTRLSSKETVTGKADDDTTGPHPATAGTT
jgi:hypothetical protein